MIAALFCLALALPAAAQSNLKSHLLVDAGKQFALGGGQPGSFTVAGRNSGPVPVEVAERPRSGAVVSRGTLAPGQRARLRFAEGSTALVVNRSARQAVLDLTVRGDTRALQMVYEPASR
ncbi:hypothetical protein GCM10023185_26270 [Hymenobacter saemangeumensis]|uniref:Uncharacterized protein n=1 Tax=Hymenobacter saemangeumensis TaxID=1084522 RepID=A0ABP8IIV7_9BACT